MDEFEQTLRQEYLLFLEEKEVDKLYSEYSKVALTHFLIKKVGPWFSVGMTFLGVSSAFFFVDVNWSVSCIFIGLLSIVPLLIIYDGLEIEELENRFDTYKEAHHRLEHKRASLGVARVAVGRPSRKKRHKGN